uniref:Uncharacterized protein n=2 Tax=Meloidogyne TaxID=189290 RepID=A0A6V7WWL5_MELEN|nr:unnamed protein product [Meloidogyne enterolobii]
MSNSFYVCLLSNTTDYPDNQPNKFRVHLPKPIYFSGDWVCGLHSISYPYSWPSTIGTLDEQWIAIHCTDFKGMAKIIRVPVPRGSHNKPEDLLKFLTSTLQHQSGSLEESPQNKTDSFVNRPTLISPPRVGRPKRSLEETLPSPPRIQPSPPRWVDPAKPSSPTPPVKKPVPLPQENEKSSTPSKKLPSPPRLPQPPTTQPQIPATPPQPPPPTTQKSPTLQPPPPTTQKPTPQPPPTTQKPPTPQPPPTTQKPPTTQPLPPTTQKPPTPQPPPPTTQKPPTPQPPPAHKPPPPQPPPAHKPPTPQSPLPAHKTPTTQPPPTQKPPTTQPPPTPQPPPTTQKPTTPQPPPPTTQKPPTPQPPLPTTQKPPTPQPLPAHKPLTPQPPPAYKPPTPQPPPPTQKPRIPSPSQKLTTPPPPPAQKPHPTTQPPPPTQILSTPQKPQLPLPEKLPSSPPQILPTQPAHQKLLPLPKPTTTTPQKTQTLPRPIQTLPPLPEALPLKQNKSVVQQKIKWTDDMERVLTHVIGKPPTDFQRESYLPMIEGLLKKYSYLRKDKIDATVQKQIIDSISLSFHKDFKRFKMEYSHPNIKYLSFSPQLGYVLGFENSNMVMNNEIAKYGSDLRGGFSSFAVYSKGLTENMIVGNSLSSLLRVVSVSGATPGEYHEKIYDSPIYIRVLPKEINEIEIELRTMDGGRLVPFAFGTVMIVLIFKKVINF